MTISQKQHWHEFRRKKKKTNKSKHTKFRRQKFNNKYCHTNLLISSYYPDSMVEGKKTTPENCHQTARDAQWHMWSHTQTHKHTCKHNKTSKMKNLFLDHDQVLSQEIKFGSILNTKKKK